MGRLAAFLIRRRGKAAAQRFEKATRDPLGAQLRKLLEIVERNQDTEYGREHSFASVRSLRDWQERVPVVSYEDIKQRMDRVTNGESNVLTAEDPVMFNRTSGTTGDAKYIPVTPTCQGRDHSDQMSAWLYHALLKHPTLFRGKVVTLVSPAIEGHTPSGVPYGSASGQIYSTMPAVVRRSYAIPYEVFLIKDYLAKYYTLMRIAVATDVSMLATANPSSIVKMCEVADANADVLLRDIADGTLYDQLPIEPDLRQSITSRLKRKAGKVRRLERARSLRDGRLLPADYWPNLALIGCWKGGTVGRYIDRFPGWFDPDREGMVPVRDWGFLSSEARGSIPLSDHGAAGVLTVATNVYEFVEVEELQGCPDDPTAWRFLTVDQLEEDGEYYVFLTTTGGLYRYDINDVVKVEGRHNATPTIRFVRKGRGMTNITGEKLSVNQVIDAFHTASAELAVTIDHYKAEADHENSRYVFKVEAPALRAEQRRPLLSLLDRELRRLNIEYHAKRESLRLGDPELHVMKKGWYDRMKQALIASGRHLFQAKTVLLDSGESHEVDEKNLDVIVTLKGG